VNKRVMVLGGDGFCGWPTSLHLANHGYEILIVDNLSRRRIDEEAGTLSLTPISHIDERIECARKLIGNVSFSYCDVNKDPLKLRSLISDFRPSTIVHFAEQRSAPYSMIDDDKRRFTVDNNINGTHNLCSAISDIDQSIHIVHLGTMGVYGYNDAFGIIPEGYLDITVNQTSEKSKILYPANPGSVYHMTKCLDQIIFQFYAKNWGIKITDLHQGIVWGAVTEETIKDPILANRFDYDGIYGTVLNRFIAQSQNNHNLTVYGTGGQQRAFIHIQNTTDCIRIATETSGNVTPGQVRIMNQVTEVFSVMELAKIVSKLTGANIEMIDNPRNELADNNLMVSNEQFLDHGLKPKKLNDHLLEDLMFTVSCFEERFDDAKVLNSPSWR